MCQLWHDSPFLTYWWQSNSLNVTCSRLLQVLFPSHVGPILGPLLSLLSEVPGPQDPQHPDFPQGMSSLRVAPHLLHTLGLQPQYRTGMRKGLDGTQLLPYGALSSQLHGERPREGTTSLPSLPPGCACETRVRCSPLGKSCGQDSWLGPGRLTAHTWPAAADTPPPTQSSQHLLCGGERSKGASREEAENTGGFQQSSG